MIDTRRTCDILLKFWFKFTKLKLWSYKITTCSLRESQKFTFNMMLNRRKLMFRHSYILESVKLTLVMHATGSGTAKSNLNKPIGHNLGTMMLGSIKEIVFYGFKKVMRIGKTIEKKKMRVRILTKFDRIFLPNPWNVSNWRIFTI